MRVAAVLVASVSFVSSQALAAPIKLVRGQLNQFLATSQQLLYADGDLSVIAQSDAEPAEFDDLYVVNASNRLSVDSLRGFGEVLEFAPMRLAVMRVGPEQVEALAGKLHSEGLACGVLTRLDRDFTVSAAAPAPTPLLALARPDARVLALTSAVDEASLRRQVEELAAIPTRFQSTRSGGGVAALLSTKYQALAAGRSDVTIAPYDHHARTAQNSLIVRIQGSKYPDEVVVLGSHLDSVNWQDGRTERAPGADDNASGTATNLEIFRLLMAQGVRPLRTVEIHAYAAEEVGLVGSQDIANAYRRRGAKVVAMVQFDMDLYQAEGEEAKVWLVSNDASRAFNRMLGQLVGHYAGLPWEERYLGGGSSDHASWYRAGFATAFPFENPDHYNPHIHTADDTVDNSGDFALVAAYTKLGLAYVLHFAGVE